MQKLPDGSGKTAGTQLGEQVAREIVAWRAADGIGAPNAYRPATSPGVYVATPLLVGFDFAHGKPWVMERSDQFRPGPPPPLTSESWARAYNESKEVGGKSSTKRTPEQAEIAQFWVVTGAPSWNPILRQFAASDGLGSVDRARLFALAYLAAADSLYSGSTFTVPPPLPSSTPFQRTMMKL